MFSKNKPLQDEFPIDAFQTLIGPKTTMEGRISFAEGIRIDGTLIGDVQVERGAIGSVAVGPDAQVRGNVTAHRVLVAGTVIGDIRAFEIVQLLATASVTGNIAYAKISICQGAQINGALSDLSQLEEAAEMNGRLIRLADKTHENVITS